MFRSVVVASSSCDYAIRAITPSLLTPLPMRPREPSECCGHSLQAHARALGQGTLHQPISRQPRLHDESRNHAEHAVLRFSMRQDMAMEGPGTGIGSPDQDVPTLSRRDVECVAPPGGGLIPAIFCDHGHMHTVEVHWMNHHALVHEPEP